MFFVILINIIIFITVSVKCHVVVTDSGVFPWTYNDYAITFYLTLNNSGNRPVAVTAAMDKCCELITEFPEDIECDHIKLTESALELQATSVKNITLLYQNIYPYNRRGKCDVRIYVIFSNAPNLESNYLRSIEFNTFLKRENVIGIRKVKKKLICDNPDEDILDSCLPVNCHMKYSGIRGYYSIMDKKCIPIPLCQPFKSMAYMWTTNQCINISSKMMEKDVQDIMFGVEEEQADKEDSSIRSFPSNQLIRCHSGKYNDSTGLCDCDSGWSSSDDIDWNNLTPSTLPLHMCTIFKEHTLKKFFLSEEFTFTVLVSFSLR